MKKAKYNVLAVWATGATGEEDVDLLYRSYVEGPQGAKFELVKELHHTSKDVKAAKAHLRRNFDVVSIAVVDESEITKSATI